MYCGIAWRQKVQDCFEHITFHYSNCCILGVKTMLNSRETDRKKSAQCKVKSRHYKWLVLITENLLKNLTNFSTTHMRICVKDATPLVGYCSWINSMPKIRAFYMQALKLTLVFASLFFEAERNLETTDSSVLIRGQWPFPVTEERHISSCFSEQAKGTFPTQSAETFLSLLNFGVFKKTIQNRVRCF